MKEQLISFETAKLAKEKGFDELCINIYSICKLQNGKKMPGYIEINKHDSSWRNSSLLNNEWAHNCFDYYCASTQSLLQKWLREIHDITIWFSDWEIKEYSVHICQKEETKYMPNKSLGTYEQALEVGLIEALKLI